MNQRHPTTEHWTLPPAGREPLAGGLRRTNLRVLEARPNRFEHHLMVVARIGPTQLEVATASEPLYFNHRNISDEYVVPMTTGDPMADAMPFRTFVSEFDTDAIAARYNHGVDQLVLHPYGWLHWPGKLRPPYRPFEFAPGMRRCGYSLVFCAWQPTPPKQRPRLTEGGDGGAVKRYGDARVPLLLADLAGEPDGEVAAVGPVRMTLRARPDHIAPPSGAYVVVIDGRAPAFPGDLVYVPPGEALAGDGIERALVVAGPEPPEPPPACWDRAPDPPFAVYEDAEPGALPVTVGELTVDATGDETAAIGVAGARPAPVPRYWLARMLFRLALHDYSLGYLETYGGFFYDDTGGRYRLGVRDGGAIELSREDMRRAVETLYRAVAPPGYRERLV